MKTLHYRITIEAPRKTVWTTMLDPESYKVWTAEFAPGCYYEGSWEEGARIRFLGPGGEGMVSQIARNRKHEFISIRHLGVVKNGIEHTDGPAVQGWAPAFENYSFSETSGATELRVELETDAANEGMFAETWPRALAKLKQICEAGPA